MLHKVLQEQQHRRASHRKDVETARKDALLAAKRLNRTLLMTVNRDLVVVHKNQQELEEQATELRKETDRFVRNTDQWLTNYRALNEAMEHISGIDRWASDVEKRLESITESLENMTSVGDALQRQ